MVGASEKTTSSLVCGKSKAACSSANPRSNMTTHTSHTGLSSKHAGVSY